MTQTKEQSNLGAAALLPGEERRRSQRVIIRVPVTIVVVENGQTVRIGAHTIAVNIHGAMLVCPRSLDANTKLELVNGRTDEKSDPASLVLPVKTPRDT